jgi:TPR repeat protein
MNINFTPPNPDIIQDFVNLQEFYPPLYGSDSDYPTVKAWLKILRIEGFDEKMMQEMLHFCLALIKKEQYSEASLLLLVSSATRNDNACYILAREIFKGKLFTANPSASFGMFSYSARNGNAEALCDLAFFYKNGITVDKNRKHALKLYKQAMEAGVKRAKIHYDSLK